MFQDWVTATDIRIVFPAMAMIKQVEETRKLKSELTIDLEASQKLPRLDLIRNEKLVQNSTSFFDQDEDDVFGSGDGGNGFDDEDDFEAEQTTQGNNLPTSMIYKKSASTFIFRKENTSFSSCV